MLAKLVENFQIHYRAWHAIKKLLAWTQITQIKIKGNY